jgi:hypothetical protein
MHLLSITYASAAGCGGLLLLLFLLRLLLLRLGLLGCSFAFLTCAAPSFGASAAGFGLFC